MGSFIALNKKPNKNNAPARDQTGVNDPGYKKRTSGIKGKFSFKIPGSQEALYKQYGITNKQEHTKPMEAPVRPKKGTDASEGSAVVNTSTGSSVSVAGESQYVQSDTSIGYVGGGKIRRKKGLSSVLGVM